MLKKYSNNLPKILKSCEISPNLLTLLTRTVHRIHLCLQAEYSICFQRPNMKSLLDDGKSFICLSIAISYFMLDFSFLNWPSPASFSFIFVFLNKHTISTTKNVNMSIQYSHCDSNQPPLEHESPPITTRPGLTPLQDFSLFV